MVLGPFSVLIVTAAESTQVRKRVELRQVSACADCVTMFWFSTVVPLREPGEVCSLSVVLFLTSGDSSICVVHLHRAVVFSALTVIQPSQSVLTHFHLLKRNRRKSCE